VQRDDVALLEERLFARRDGVTVLARTQPRRFARQDEHFHAEGLSVSRHHGADPAVAEDSQRLSAHGAADAACHFPALMEAICLGISRMAEMMSPMSVRRLHKTACRNAG